MIVKTIKYLLLILLVLLLLLIGLLSFVLYSESGSRMALNYGLKLAEVDITYQELQGNLASGMAFTDLSYTADGVQVTVKNLAYQSDWRWFDRHVTLNKLQASQVWINLETNDQPSTEPFSGFEMPLTIDINALQANEITLSQDGELLQTIDAVKLTAQVQSDRILLQDMQVKAPDQQLQIQGETEFGQGLAYALQTQWQLTTDSTEVNGQVIGQVNGQGSVNGNLEQVQLNQQLDLKLPALKGPLSVQGEMLIAATSPTVQLSVSSKQLQITTTDSDLILSDLNGHVSGAIDAYQLGLTGILQPTTVADQPLPTSKLSITGQGTATAITVEQASIDSAAGTIDLSGQVDWQNQLSLSGQLNTRNFSPQAILPDWPGDVSGEVFFEVQQVQDGWRIETSNNQLSGTLKGQAFELSGAVVYQSEAISSDNLLIKLGDNEITMNGQMTANEVDLVAAVNATELSLLSSSLKGQVVGDLKLSGQQQQPNIDLNLQVTEFKYQNNHIDQLSISSQGVWESDLTSTINISQAVFNSFAINNAQVNQTGWLDEHQISFAMTTPDLTTSGDFSGGLMDAQKSPIKTLTELGVGVAWQGQLNQHQLVLDTKESNETNNAKETIELQSPVGITYNQRLQIEQACWLGVSAGTLCIKLQDIAGTEALSGAISMSAFNVLAFKTWLPQGLEIIGLADGQADFNWSPDNLIIDGRLALNGGEIKTAGVSKNEYQADIETLILQASTNQGQVTLNGETEWSDGSQFKVQGTIHSSPGTSSTIDASLSGKFINTAFIAELTEEVSEIQGQLQISGDIQGTLDQPRINFNLSQPEGYLQLARLGTLIEQSTINISTTGANKPVYVIEYHGINVPKSNEGEVTSQGELSLTDKGWLYQGRVTGNSFMVVNTPQAKFNVTPDVQIKATNEQLDLRGDIVIDYGHVKVSQLPPSTVSNSADLVVVTAEEDEETAYQVVLDLNAKIKDVIELDVTGLDADLQGGIQLKQGVNEKLQAYGNLSLVDGTYEIYNQKLDIITGELNFNGQLDNPKIAVKAARKATSDDVVAGVELGGTLTNLRSTLYSNPEVPDVEKLTYIMTGQGINNANNLDAAALEQTALLLGISQTSPLFNQIQNQFGIDVFTIKGGNDEQDTVLEAGKNLGNRFYVSYNQGLFDQLGYWLIKYKINKYLNLETTQGEAQSVDLVYTRQAEVEKRQNKQTDEADN